MVPQSHHRADCCSSGWKNSAGPCCGRGRVTAIAQDADGVTATLDDGAVIRARYAVGADGIRSIVREQAGIGFEGGVYEESFVLADVRLSGDAPHDEVDPVLGDSGSDRGGAVARRRLPNRRAGRRRARGTVDVDSSRRSSTPAWARGGWSSPTLSGAHVSGFTTASPTPIARAGCCWPVTRPMCTAPQAAKA